MGSGLRRTSREPHRDRAEQNRCDRENNESVKIRAHRGGRNGLNHEPEIRDREAAEVRKDRAHIPATDAEPFGHRRGELIDGSGRNPAAGAGVIRTADGEGGPAAKSPLAIDAPPMIMWWLPQP